MPYLINGPQLLLTSGDSPMEQATIAMAVAGLITLFILLYQLSDIRKQLTRFYEKWSKDAAIREESSNTITASARKAQPTVDFDLEADELTAVLAAAIYAYEADLTSQGLTEETVGTADMIQLAAGPERLTAPVRWNAPTTAGFRVRSIKRVS